MKYGKGTLDVPGAGAASESASALLTFSLSTRAISKASAAHMASTAPLHQDTPTYHSRWTVEGQQNSLAEGHVHLQIFLYIRLKADKVTLQSTQLLKVYCGWGSNV